MSRQWLRGKPKQKPPQVVVELQKQVAPKPERPGEEPEEAVAPVWALRPSPDFLGHQVADSLERFEGYSVVEGSAALSFEALLLADSPAGFRGSEVEALVFGHSLCLFYCRVA